MLEGSLRIGDRLSIGSAEFLVTQPRLPCFKLAVRFGRPDMVKRFHRSARTGFYLAVVREGSISPGDPIQIVSEAQPTVTVAEIARLYTADEAEQDILRRASEIAALVSGIPTHEVGWRAAQAVTADAQQLDPLGMVRFWRRSALGGRYAPRPA